MIGSIMGVAADYRFCKEKRVAIKPGHHRWRRRQPAARVEASWGLGVRTKYSSTTTLVAAAKKHQTEKNQAV